MQIKLVDGTIYLVNRADVTDGWLEIDFQTQTAEILQEIFTESANLANLPFMSVLK